VPQRPYVLLSVAMSVDGCIDDASDTRLILSNDADLDRVDEVRAGCDAILVGAGTVRRDNPALLVRSAARRSRRLARGLAASPVKVTVTASGGVDPAARFFTAGEGARLVYVPAAEQDRIRGLLAGAPGAEVIGIGTGQVSLAAMLGDLAGRGVWRLLVEGGGRMLAQFLAQGLADELDLVIAPVFVGDPAAPRIGGASAPLPLQRMHLAEARLIGDVVLLRYLPAAPSLRPR
jgi:5-amino-6-(5-phosphoribosylamino)uracil reductase